MTNRRVVDRDRQRVYDAEDAAFGGTTMDEALEWHEVEVLVAAVVADPWWTSLGIVTPRLRAARSDARTSCSDGEVVRISREGQTAVTVVHELAHHLSGHLAWPADPEGPSPHDGRFRATALRVATIVGGTPGADALARSWERHGLCVAAWPWGEPVGRPPRALRGARALGAISDP